jgi:peptide methionine sulfoxide reductase MsrB
LILVFVQYQRVANESPLSQSVSVMRIEVNGFSLATHWGHSFSEGWLTTHFDQ